MRQRGLALLAACLAGLCVSAAGGSPAVGGGPGEPQGAVPVLSTEPIPARIGDSNGATYVIRTGGLPPGVSRERFVAIARNSARRWGLTFGGLRPGRPRLFDGRSEIGFNTAVVPRGALGITSDSGRRRQGGRERDVIIRADLRWQEGPVHPDRREFDLETVLLHELGHFAGNARHVARACSDTPLVVGLSRGEWWRSSADFFYRACAAAPPAT